MPPTVLDTSCIGSLREQIEESLVYPLSERSFLPVDKLDEIFTLAAIKAAVEELPCGPDDRIKLAETIYAKGKRVFAMLIENDWEDHITEFRKHGKLDDQLPLSETDAVDIVGKSRGRRIANELQWKFYPYVFPESMSSHHHEVKSKMILPFTSAESIGTGAFGVVEKMTISASQQNFVDKRAEKVQVVRKRLKVKGETEESKREAMCLRLLNQLQHPNIIPFLGSYTYHEEHSFLFPFFDMDLRKLLEAEDHYQDFQWDFTYFSALAGLASALSKTHNLRLTEDKHDINFESIGYHHDFRPPNILVSPDNFILADFGLGHLKPAEALSYTPFKSNAGDYIAPECTDMEERPQTANRAVDIWAFGCLVAEVTTYMLKGRQGVKEFQEKRLTPGRLPQFKDSGFYQPLGGIKNEVVAWMNMLRDNFSDDLAAQLVQLSLDALNPDPQSRPRAKDIHWRLAAISLQKHFRSAQETFSKVCDPGRSEAWTLFEQWGDVFILRMDRSSDAFYELSETAIGMMKALFKVLRKEPETQQPGDGSGIDNLALQSVRDLWRLLPVSLCPSLPDRLIQLDQRNGADNDKPPPGMATPINTLQSELEKAARVFKDSLPKSVPLSEILETRTLNDLYEIAENIQAEQHEHSGLRNLNSIAIFLTRLETYDGIISDNIHESRDIIACLWGPVAFLLQRAAMLDKAFDSLVSATAEVGRSIPDFSAICDRGTETEDILVLFFGDLLNFYHEVLKSFYHNNWEKVFDRLWPKHHANIVEIKSHMERLIRLLKREIHVKDIQEEYEFRKYAIEKFDAKAKNNRQLKFSGIVASIGPCNYNNALNELRGRPFQDSMHWFFTTKVFEEWVHSLREDSQILWVNGIPGAGKTVLSSKIVSHLREKYRAKTAFAFLTYRDAKTSALSTIQSLLFQLVGRDEDLIAIVCGLGDEDLMDLSAAGNVLASLLLYVGCAYFIIDGIDEISEIERGRLVTELFRIAKSCQGLRIAFSGRPEADLVRNLSKAVTIQVNKCNEGSIYDYVSQRSQDYFRRHNVAPWTQKEITSILQPVAKRANGMFLYARLIMDMFHAMYDLSEMQEQLQVLPENLDDAYRRIIDRLAQNKDSRSAKQAWRLLGWIACTSSPFTVEEAQQALLVKPGDQNQVFAAVGYLDVVGVIGPIVEVVDHEIRFVHFTAKEYIYSPHIGAQLIGIEQSTLDLATQCIHYLCQHHHDLKLPYEERADKVSSGQYSFHAFSNRMWFELVCQYFRLVKTRNPSASLINSMNMLSEIRGIEDGNDVEDDGNEIEDDEDKSDIETVFQSIKEEQPQLYALLCRISRFRNSSFLFTGKTNRDLHKNKKDPLMLFDVSQEIRHALEKALCNSAIQPSSPGKSGCHESCANILRHYGPRPFKCMFPLCDFSQHGFTKRSTRRSHESRHGQSLKCNVAGCEFAHIGFLSKKQRDNHFKEAHINAASEATSHFGDPSQHEIEALLPSLVQNNQIETVQQVLSVFLTPARVW